MTQIEESLNKGISSNDQLKIYGEIYTVWSIELSKFIVSFMYVTLLCLFPFHELYYKIVNTLVSLHDLIQKAFG